MTTAITVSPVMDVAAHKDAINAIQGVLQHVMIKGEHYGTIPGCGSKPALLKPGAEKIMATFGIRPEVEVDELDEERGHRRFRVKVKGLSHSGDFLGEGIGEASTAEEKFAWESAKCEEHWNSMPESQRRIRWRVSNGRTYQDQQVQTNPADKANTALKIAKKRAMVDMVLTVTAASDIFEQDLDEEHLRPAEMQDAPSPVEPPKRKSDSQPAPKPAASQPRQQPRDTKGGDMTVVGEIKRVTRKEGEGRNGPWTKFGIMLDNGEWYNTFDTEVGGFAEERGEGARVEISYSDDKYGHQATSIGDEMKPTGTSGDQSDIPF